MWKVLESALDKTGPEQRALKFSREEVQEGECQGIADSTLN